jgi:hypothetical protein
MKRIVKSLRNVSCVFRVFIAKRFVRFSVTRLRLALWQRSHCKKQNLNGNASETFLLRVLAKCFSAYMCTHMYLLLVQEPSPTVVSYNASVVKLSNATNRVARF